MTGPVNLAHVRAAKEMVAARELDYVPLSNEENLRRATAFLDRLYGRTFDYPEIRAGDCDDCGRTVLRRWRVGRFGCCRGCAHSRQAAKGRAA